MALRYCTNCGRASGGERCAFCGKPFVQGGGTGAYWTARDLAVALLTILGALILLFAPMISVYPLSVNLHMMAFSSAVSGSMFSMIAQLSAEGGAALVLLKVIGGLFYATIIVAIVSLFRKIDRAAMIVRWIAMVVGAVIFALLLYARGQISSSLLAMAAGAVRLTSGLGVAMLVGAITLERSRGALPRVLYHLANGQPAYRQNNGGQRLAPSSGSITCTRGAFAGARFDLAGSSAVVIGRSPRESQIVLPQGEAQVSRKHALVSYSSSDNCYYVTDYSRNGTYLSGGVRAPSGQPCRVTHGTSVYLDKHGRNAFLLE